MKALTKRMKRYHEAFRRRFARSEFALGTLKDPDSQSDLAE